MEDLTKQMEGMDLNSFEIPTKEKIYDEVNEEFKSCFASLDTENV